MKIWSEHAANMFVKDDARRIITIKTDEHRARFPNAGQVWHGNSYSTFNMFLEARGAIRKSILLSQFFETTGYDSRRGLKHS